MENNWDEDEKYEGYITAWGNHRTCWLPADRVSSNPDILDYHVWKPNGEKCPVTWMDGKGNGIVIHYNEDGSVYSRMVYISGKVKIHIKDSVIMDGGNPAIKKTWKSFFS